MLDCFWRRVEDGAVGDAAAQRDGESDQEQGGIKLDSCGAKFMSVDPRNRKVATLRHSG